jgi:hypothetical protein
MQFPIVLVAHGGVYVLVAEDELGDVRGMPWRMASVVKILLLSALSVFGLTRVAIDMAFILRCWQ